MYLKTYVETALNKLNSSKYENTAFSERLEVAAALLKGVPFEERSSRAPFFLNDLGVRFTESPREFAAWNSDKIDVTLPTSNEILNDLMKFNIHKLHYLLDAVVLITGDYDSVVQAVLQRKQEILSNGSYEALIYSGTAAASREKKDAYDFFSAAIKRAPDVNHVITGYHRLIVSKMKRFHDSKNLRQLMDQMVSIEIPKSAERKLYFALFENLLGLGMVMEEAPLSWISAKTSLLVAADYISEFLQESTNIDLISQARRYQGQVGINMVQLEVSNNDLDQALIVATENLDNVKKYSTDYVAEAYNTLGYTEYLCKNYKDAIVHLKTAVDEQSKIGNLDGIIDARRILISCYVKLKDNKKAETEARLIIEKSFEFED